MSKPPSLIEVVSNLISTAITNAIVSVALGFSQAFLLQIAWNYLAGKFFTFLPSMWWNLEYLEVFCMLMVVTMVRQVILGR